MNGSTSAGKSSSAIHKGFVAFVYLAGVFGAQLHLFSENGLDDPIISPWYAISKDLIFIVLSMCAIAVTRRYSRLGAIHALVVFVAFFLLFGYFAIISSDQLSQLSLLKNIVLYNVLVFFVLASFVCRANSNWLYWHLRRAVLLGLIVSLATYVNDPAASYTLRNFGVFGNPNALAYFAVLYHVLIYDKYLPAYSFYQKALALVVVVLSIVTAASFTGVILFLVASVMIYLSKNTVVRSLHILSSLMLCLLLLIVMINAAQVPDLVRELGIFARIESLMDLGFGHETIGNRLRDYIVAFEFLGAPDYFVLADAGASTLVLNYQIPGLLFLLAMFLVPVLLRGAAFAQGATELDLGLDSSRVIALVLMPLNLMLQYSVVAFPGNLFSSIIVYTMIVRMRSRGGNYSPMLGQAGFGHASVNQAAALR